MNAAVKPAPSSPKAAEEARRADALRENLKKRKEQQRQREET